LAFLVVKKTDNFRLVFEGDPAVKSSESPPTWLQEEKAELESGERPDVLVCRPLGSDEVLRIVNAIEVDSSLIVSAAALGVVKIEQADGTIIEEPKEIRDVLNMAQNLEAVTSLAQTIFEASREGLDSLPFRGGGA
jgi:hypothetical protein